MGVNYYLKKLPSKERKEELIEAVKKDDVNTIRNLTNNMYNNLIHLGKSSIGWQFNFNPNYELQFNYETGDIKIIYAFPLTREGIDKFIRQDGYIIVDEDEEESMIPTISPDEFWKKVDSKKNDIVEMDDASNSYWRDTNKNTYINFLKKDYPNGDYSYHNSFVNDGLRFSYSTEFS